MYAYSASCGKVVLYREWLFCMQKQDRLQDRLYIPYLFLSRVICINSLYFKILNFQNNILNFLHNYVILVV